MSVREAITLLAVPVAAYLLVHSVNCWTHWNAVGGVLGFTGTVMVGFSGTITYVDKSGSLGLDSHPLRRRIQRLKWGKDPNSAFDRQKWWIDFVEAAGWLLIVFSFGSMVLSDLPNSFCR